jgi:hypothetical protein
LNTQISPICNWKGETPNPKGKIKNIALIDMGIGPYQVGFDLEPPNKLVEGSDKT